MALVWFLNKKQRAPEHDNKARGDILVSIDFDCPNCGKRFVRKDEAEGRRAKCPCGAVFRIQPRSIAGTESSEYDVRESSDIQETAQEEPMVIAGESEAIEAKKKMFFATGAIAIAVAIAVGISLFVSDRHQKQRLACLEAKVRTEECVGAVINSLRVSVGKVDIALTEVLLKSAKSIRPGSDISPLVDERLLGQSGHSTLGEAMNHLKQAKDAVMAINKPSKELKVQWNKTLELCELCEQYHTKTIVPSGTLYGYMDSMVDIRDRFATLFAELEEWSSNRPILGHDVATESFSKLTRYEMEHKQFDKSVMAFHNSGIGALKSLLSAQVTTALLLAKLNGNDNKARFLSSLDASPILELN